MPTPAAQGPVSPIGDPREAAVRELGWNDRVGTHEHLPSYDPTKDKYSRLYNAPQAASLDPKHTARPTKDDIRGAFRVAKPTPAPGFASVAAAFDFEHHVGSNPALELQVLKIVVLREGLLSQIEALVEVVMRPPTFPGDDPDYDAATSEIIQLLAQTRDRSVEVIEAIEAWRQGFAGVAPPPFVWQNTNYLLKMCNDLDYLSQVPPLVVTLGVRRDSMIHNPLMLENTLDTRAPSREGAAEGTAEPEEDEAVKQEKARLRQAEAALVAEEAQAELASSQASIQGAWESRSRGNESMVMTDGMPRRGQETELLGWYSDAKAQLARLRETPLNNRTTTKSTGRMAIPRREKLQPMNHLVPNAVSTDLPPPPRTLTDLLSTSPAAAAAANKPRSRAVLGDMYGRKGSATQAAPPSAFRHPPSRSGDPATPLGTWGPHSRTMRNGTPTQRDEAFDASTGRQQPGDASNEEEVMRPMTPSVREPLSASEFDALIAIDEPSEAVAVVAAAVLILITPGNSVPSDVRWSALVAQPRDAFLASLRALDPLSVPKFKLRALRRFLSVDAFNPLALHASGYPGAASLAVYVLRVIAAHPEGGPIIKEVNGALVAWDEARQAPAPLLPNEGDGKGELPAGEGGEAGAVASAPKKKTKKSKGKKKSAEDTAAIPSDEGDGALSPRSTLVRALKVSAQALNKNVMGELKALSRGKATPASYAKVIEAVAAILEPKKKTSISSVWVKASLSGQVKVAKGEPTIEVRLSGFSESEAEGLARTPKSLRTVVSLCEDGDLEEVPLGRASKSLVVLMQWVRAACALAVTIDETLKAEAQSATEQHHAAAKLQSLQRQRDANLKVQQRREELKLAQEKYDAAAKVQALQRQRDAEKAVAKKRKEAAEAKEQNKAASKLQSKQRQRDATKTVAAKRQEKETKEQNSAAAKLQSKQRQRNATKVVASRRQEKSEAANRVKLEYDTKDATMAEEKEIFALSRAAVDADAHDSDGYDDGYDDEYEDDHEHLSVASPTAKGQDEPTATPLPETHPVYEAAGDEATAGEESNKAAVGVAAAVEIAATDNDTPSEAVSLQPLAVPAENEAFATGDELDNADVEYGNDEKDANTARFLSTAGSDGYGDEGFDDDDDEN